MLFTNKMKESKSWNSKLVEWDWEENGATKVPKLQVRPAQLRLPVPVAQLPVHRLPVHQLPVHPNQADRTMQAHLWINLVTYREFPDIFLQMMILKNWFWWITVLVEIKIANSGSLTSSSSTSSSSTSCSSASSGLNDASSFVY